MNRPDLIRRACVLLGFPESAAADVRVRVEEMSADFFKYHLDGPWSFPVVLHHFRAPDRGDPHDHPWGFQSYILEGGYVEEQFGLRSDSWSTFLKVRFPDTSHRVDATRIHRIVELPAGECWTMILPGPLERVWRYWRFDDGPVRSRAWNEAEFTVEGVAA